MFSHLVRSVAIVHFATAIMLTTAVARAADITWTGSANGTWDTTATNWNDGVGPVAYTDGAPGDAVSFVGGLNRTIALASTYTPDSIGFNNASGTDFAFSGGGIDGSGALSKAGAGNATFGETTSFAGYSGPVAVSGGKLIRERTTTGTTSFGSGTVSLSSGGELVMRPGTGWGVHVTFTNPINVADTGGKLTHWRRNDGQGSTFDGPITLNGGTLSLDVYTPSPIYTTSANLKNVSLTANSEIAGLHNRLLVYLQGAITTNDHALTLSGETMWLQAAGSIDVGTGSLVVKNRLVAEDRANNAAPFVLMDAGGAIRVADGGRLVLNRGTATNLIIEDGGTVQHGYSAGTAFPTSTIQNALSVGTDSTVWLSMYRDTWGGPLSFANGATFGSGSRLYAGPQGGALNVYNAYSYFSGTARFLDGSRIEGDLQYATGTTLWSGTLIFGDDDPYTPETVTIKGKGPGVMAFTAASATDVGGLTLRYEAASAIQPFKVGWGAVNYTGGNTQIGSQVLEGSAATVFAPNGSAIWAIGPTSGTVFTANAPASVETAGTVRFYHSSSIAYNWQIGAQYDPTDLGPVVVAAGGSFTTAVTGATVEASSITVQDGGALEGHGTFRAAVTIADGGVVSPGTSIGTLTIDGDATFESGARLVIEIDDPEQRPTDRHRRSQPVRRGGAGNRRQPGDRHPVSIRQLWLAGRSWPVLRDTFLERQVPSAVWPGRRPERNLVHRHPRTGLGGAPGVGGSGAAGEAAGREGKSGGVA